MIGFDRLIGCLLWRLFCGVSLRILCQSSENCLEIRLLSHVVYWNCDEALVVMSMRGSINQLLVSCRRASEG